MVLWIISAILMVLAVAVLVPAFLRKNLMVEGDDKSQNVLIAKERLKEMESELADGTVSQETFDQSKEELEHGLLDDVSSGDATSEHMEKGFKFFGMALVLILVPLITMATYLSLGSPPPMGFVDGAEWERILSRFEVKQRGGSLQKWAVVSKRTNGERISDDDTGAVEHHRLRSLRKKLG